MLFHKFSVQDHLYEHYCTFEQFCVVSGFVCVALIYFFFIIKHEPLVGETLIEIESAVAKQTKKSNFNSFKTLPARVFYHHQIRSKIPTSKLELAATIINAPQSMSSLPYWLGDSRIYHLLPILLLSCKISSISNNSPQPLISLCF